MPLVSAFPDLHLGACSIYEYWRPKFLRDYALKVALGISYLRNWNSTSDHIRYEDRETHYICIGPVNKALDMLVEYWASTYESQGRDYNQAQPSANTNTNRNRSSSRVFDALAQHRDRVKDYLWLAADGMKMQVRKQCLFKYNVPGIQWISALGYCFQPSSFDGDGTLRYNERGQSCLCEVRSGWSSPYLSRTGATTTLICLKSVKIIQTTSNTTDTSRKVPGLSAPSIMDGLFPVCRR